MNQFTLNALLPMPRGIGGMLLVVLAMLLPPALFAQVTVSIVANPGTTQLAPLGSTQHHASEHLYLASEIGQNFTINRINLSMANNGDGPAPDTYNNVTIYLAYTALTAFTTGTFSTVGYTPVYTGPIAWTANGYAGVYLTTPFPYAMASGNLKMMIVRADGVLHTPLPTFDSARGSAAPGTATTTTSRRFNGAAAPTGASSLAASAFRAKVQFINDPNCSGTPTPGNTLQYNACASGFAALRLQNATPGPDVTYQWQYADDIGFTTGLTNLGTRSEQYTNAFSKYHRCIVTCPSAGTPQGISTPLFVEALPATMCSLCAASSLAGTGNEYISNVAFANVNNESRFIAGGYEDFRGIVGTVQQNVNMTVTVTLAPGYTTDEVQVWCDWNRDGVFANDASELMYTSTPLGAGPHTGSFTVPLSAGLGLTAMRVRLHDATDGPMYNPCGTSTWGQVEDYGLLVTPAPACLPPSGISAQLASTTDANIAWNPAAGAASYNVEVRQGGLPGSGGAVYSNTVAAPGTSDVATGLSIGQTYQVYVRTDCGGTQSAWVGPVSLLMDYCLVNPVVGVNNNVITNFTYAGINNNNASTAGYLDFTALVASTPVNIAQPFTLARGQNFNLDSVAIWIDLNNDYDFLDAGEDVFSTAGSMGAVANPLTGSITIPSGTTTGNKRMRVFRGNTTPGFGFSSPCGNPPFGQVHDYTVNVCSPPVALTSVNCLGGAFSISVNVTDFGSAPTGTISYTVNGGGAVNVPASPGITTLDNGGPGFASSDVVSISVSNGSACSLVIGDHFSNCPIALTCGGPATPGNHCYGNQDPRTFTYSTDFGETITLIFQSGSIGAGDVVTFYDGTDNSGTVLPNPPGNGFSNGSLAGLVITTTGNNLFIDLETDGSGSCQDGGAGSPWLFSVQCTPDCEPAEATVIENSDCGTYSYTLDVEINSLGTGLPFVPPLTPETEVFVSYSVNGGAYSTPTGPYAVFGTVTLPTSGSFVIGDVVNVKLVHGSDALCDRIYGPYDGDLGCPPPGESCSLPIVIPSVPTTVTGTTTGRSDNHNSVCPFTPTGGRDVVYSYTPPVNQTISLTMCLGTTNYDTKLYVFANDCSGAAIACQDDACTAPLYAGGLDAFVSSIPTLAVTAGTTYYIVVDGYDAGSFGNYTLDISIPPSVANDECANAEPIDVHDISDCPSLAEAGDNSFATGDGLVSSCLGGTLQDVWFTFDAGTNTSVSFAFPTFAFTTVGVDVFSACGGAEVFCADGVISGVIPVTPGQSYWMRVASAPGTGGAFTLCLNTPPPPPANDNCADATAVTSYPYNSPLTSTALATDDFTAVAGYGCGTGPFQNVWWTVTGICGTMTASTCGSSFDTEVAVYTGTCGSLTYVACNDDAVAGPCSGTLQSQVSWTATQGTIYYIAAGGWDAGNFGDLQLNVTGASDTDGDGIGNTCDNCAAVSNANQANADGDATGDVCDACPLDALNDQDADGLCANVDNCPTISNAGQENNDGDTQGDVCDTDDDNDGVLDVSDNCPLTANAGQENYDGDTQGDACDTDDDNDGILDINDSCPLFPGQNGGTCDADPSPGGYTLGTITGCACVAAPCTQSLTIDWQTDANPGQITWEIRNQTGGGIVQSGAPLNVPNATFPTSTCVPNGCYYLRVIDAGGDGMTVGSSGGYTLKTSPGGVRLLDNFRNFGNLAGGPPDVSSIPTNEGFCIPMGTTTGAIYTSCDKLDWTAGEYLVCSSVPAIAALYGGANAATSGYEFWFFNPNGGYSFRKFRAHNVSDGFSPANGNRACHIKLNNWAAASYIPTGVLMNVRVRTRNAGVNGNWGPACRMMIDPVRAQCPLTKLMDIPGNEFLSCGATRNWGAGNYVHAVPVTGANKYQFRFRITGEPTVITRTTTAYFLQLNWTPVPAFTTYYVDVRCSKDNGATWCTDFVPPAMVSQWGDFCNLTISAPAANGGNQNITTHNPGLSMYPNPNRGDQLYLSLDAVEEGVNTVSVDIFDLFGKRVSARTIAVNDGFINTVLDLDGDMANGMYMVNITAGEKTYTERLVISK